VFDTIDELPGLTLAARSVDLVSLARLHVRAWIWERVGSGAHQNTAYVDG
jgi:hypothetical protein